MSEAVGLAVGWCPGALRPMESGDGLIVRVRPRLGRLSVSQLELLGEAAQRFGDSNLHLSNRGNVQIRGVSEAAHSDLLRTLREADLVDCDPRIEAVRNVMVVPPAGPHALQLASSLVKLLAETKELHELPGKFGVAVQTGEAIDTGVTSDVTFIAGERRIAMVLDGDLQSVFLLSDLDSCLDAFRGVASVFLASSRRDRRIRRMRDAVRVFGRDEVARNAGLKPSGIGLPPIDGPAPVGDLGAVFGMAFAFGEVTQAALADIVRTMRRADLGQAAVSTHRALVFAVTDETRGEFSALADRIEAIANPSDIRLRVHACPGMPACGRATVPARRDAEEVVKALRTRDDFQGTVHISGCEKRCAYPRHASIAAIGAGGRYTVSASGRETFSVAQTGVVAIVSKLAEAL